MKIVAYQKKIAFYKGMYHLLSDKLKSMEIESLEGLNFH